MKRLPPSQHYPNEVHSWSRVATASGEDGDIRDRLVTQGPTQPIFVRRAN